MNKLYLLIAGILVIGGIAFITYKQDGAPTTEVATSTVATSTQTATSSNSVANELNIGVIFTMADVAAHTSTSSCYTVVEGNVYDLTNWISKHPGGKDAILGLCGKDGTVAFTKQHGSSEKAKKALASFLLGSLTP